MTPPLEHLKVWEGRGTSDDIMVDYISIGYLDKHLGVLRKSYDQTIIRGIITQELVLEGSYTLLLDKLHSTVLFRQLWFLFIDAEDCEEFDILPYLEQIKELNVWTGIIPSYSLDIDLPLVNTLQRLHYTSEPWWWMFGRVFRALTKCSVSLWDDEPWVACDPEVDMPACTELEWRNAVATPPFSCVNLQIFSWENDSPYYRQVDLRSLREFLLNCPCLQQFNGLFYHTEDHVIPFAFCDAWEQGVWKSIRSVKVDLWGGEGQDLIQKYGHKEHYEKWWKEFTVSDGPTFMASM